MTNNQSNEAFERCRQAFEAKYDIKLDGIKPGTYWHVLWSGFQAGWQARSDSLYNKPGETLQSGGHPLDMCPGCGGPADNGFDRCLPPNPYLCTECEQNLIADTIAQFWGEDNNPEDAAKAEAVEQTDPVKREAYCMPPPDIRYANQILRADIQWIKLLRNKTRCDLSTAKYWHDVRQREIVEKPVDAEAVDEALSLRDRFAIHAPEPLESEIADIAYTDAPRSGKVRLKGAGGGLREQQEATISRRLARCILKYKYADDMMKAREYGK